MAAAGGEQRDLLALIHQHLVQSGYGKAARELLLQSGQKNFPPSPVLLRDIFTQWKKTSLQSQKQNTDDVKRDALTKIRVPDPKTSSESEEEEVVKPIATNLSVNNRSVAEVESSSEDEDSSSEEEAVAEKTVKTSVAGSKTANFLQLAAQKSNSLPGKGVAVAALQTKDKPSKVVSNKQPLPDVVKTKQQNKVLSSRPGPLILAGKSPAQAATAKKSSSSESSDSSSVESEEEKTTTVAKPPAPTQALKKAESSSEDSSDDSEEEATNTAAVQIKAAVHIAQTNTTSAKSLQTTAVLSKAYPAQATANQTRAGLGSTAGRAKPAESSETSDSSDSEDEDPASVVQAKLLGKTPQALISPVKNAPSALLSKKVVHAPTPLKQAAKPSGTGLRKAGLLSSTKAAGSTKDTESSESSSESETSPVPVSQKRLQTPQPPTAAKQSQADKAGPPVKAASSALKGKESKSSSSSDSEDEMVPATPNLPPPPTAKTNSTAVLAGVKKLHPPSVSLPKAQESEDSSEDSSDESGLEEDTVFTQKPAQVTQKPGVMPAKTPAIKAAGAKAGNVQSAGKTIMSPAKSAAASLRKEPESSETDSSDSSDSENDMKQAKQQTLSGNAATPSGKGSQSNVTVTDSISSICQGKGPAVKVVPSPFKKAKLGQAQPAKQAVILNRKESSGSSSSSDSEEETPALTIAKQIAQPASMLQKQEALKKAESSSEESSDEDLEPSQSLLTGYPGLLKTPTPAAPKNASSVLSKQTSGKTTATTATPVIGAFAKSSEKAPFSDSSSTDSSNSDTDAEETPARQKPEIGLLPSFARDAVVAKRTVGAKTVPGSINTQVPPAKKSRKAQSNGRAKGATAKPVQMLSVVPPEGVCSKSEEKTVAQVSDAAAQGDMPSNLHVASKALKTPKSSEAGAVKKAQKKRKLATGDDGLGEPKGKKLKVQSGLEVLKKKKKKSKSSGSTSTPKKKEGKEKKSNKKKKKSKELKSPTSNASQKKKKKKKKTGDVEGAA